MESVKIIRPDDFHVHFRDGEMMRSVVPFTARHFARGLAMPNVPAIHTGAEATAYRDRIEAVAGDGFRVIPCLKLTHRTTPEMIRAAGAAGVLAAKIYPSGVTNASHDGIVDPRELREVYGAMADCGMVLCIHGEAPGAFILDREEEYHHHVGRIAGAFSSLRVVLEHITTAASVYFVADGPPNLAATITCHHLIHSLDDILASGLRPHHFCYPVPKRPNDRESLRKAAFGEYGDKFIFGSDSAPHRREDKESACGCAGCFTSPSALSVLAEVFLGGGRDYENQLQAFTSERGADFYGLPRNAGTLTFVREPWQVPDEIGGIVPFGAGTWMNWRVK